MFTKYGTDNIIVMLAISAILIISSFFVSKSWLSYPLAGIGIILAVFTFWFFRDPPRKVPEKANKDNSYIVAPADGKVVMIVPIDENKYIHGKATQLSIFLSPLDVHVNRSPVSGRVEYFKYNPGDYLVAYHPKSSELNEHSLIGVMTSHGKVMFKQIVGIIARRIVCVVNQGDSLTVGQQIGMMKFGSRMDVMFDPNTEIFVKVGDKVIGGETIIAKLK